MTHKDDLIIDASGKFHAAEYSLKLRDMIFALLAGQTVRYLGREGEWKIKADKVEK